MTLVVLDTCVLVSAIRSRRGASWQLLSLLGRGAFDIAVSVPLVLEYEDALLRHAAASGLTEADIGHMVDYVCKVARRQEIFYLWRPLLKDPKDEMVAEVAIAADCEAVVTHNIRDFGRLGEFAVEVVRPRVFLARLRGKR